MPTLRYARAALVEGPGQRPRQRPRWIIATFAGLALTAFAILISPQIFAQKTPGEIVSGITTNGPTEYIQFSRNEGLNASIQIEGTWGGATAVPEMSLYPGWEYVLIPNGPASFTANGIHGPGYYPTDTRIRFTISGATGTTDLRFIVRQ